MDLLNSTLDFMLFTVILKVIVAHWLGERITDYSKRLFNSSERNLAIWLHYKEQVSGKGHLTRSVLHCTEAKCAIFHHA